MASDPSSYLADIELDLIASQIVIHYEVVRSWANTDDGYFRVRAVLANGDFLEATEYFILEQERVEIVDYRHQWMDDSRTILRRRWDCTPHHSEVESFPYHVHVYAEDQVVTGQRIGIIELLLLLEREMTG